MYKPVLLLRKIMRLQLGLWTFGNIVQYISQTMAVNCMYGL